MTDPSKEEIRELKIENENANEDVKEEVRLVEELFQIKCTW